MYPYPSIYIPLFSHVICHGFSHDIPMIVPGSHDDFPTCRPAAPLQVSLDAHVHRIGRTGRAGKKGEAYSLLQSEVCSGMVWMVIMSNGNSLVFW